MEDIKLKVLVAMEESQRVCSEFRALGHEAYSCDLKPCSGGHPEWHIQGDALSLLNGRCKFITMDGKSHSIEGKWDCLVEHPECRYLSISGAARYKQNGIFNQERYEKGLKAQDFFLECLKADCDHIAVENPIHLTKLFNLIPRYTQTIQPYWFRNRFGENYQKTTRLWLKGLPCLIPDPECAEKNEETRAWVNAGTRQNGGGTRKRVGIAKKASDRAKTFRGVAQAMAQTFSSYIIERMKAEQDEALEINSNCLSTGTCMMEELKCRN